MFFSILRQVIFIFFNYLSYSKNSNLNELSKKGYVTIDNLIPLDYCTKLLNKKIKDEITNHKYISKYKPLDKCDLDYLISLLKREGIINLIKCYLGKQLICYDNTLLFLGDKTSKEESWVPHHDGKENRLKVYIFLVSTNDNNQPLDYQVGSHKFIKTWKTYSDTRFYKYPNQKKVKRIYNKIGDILIFDTHGIHSNLKMSKNFRASIVLTFESIGFFKRINDHSISGKREIERLKKLNLDNFIYV